MVKKQNNGDPGKTAWKALLYVLRKRNTISSAVLAQLVKEHTQVSPDYALRYLQRKGVLQRPENGPRGVYVVAHGKGGAYFTDPISVVQVIYGKNVLFGYGTALFLHGLSRYGRLSEYYVVSSTKRKRLSMGDFAIRFVKTPLPEEIGISTICYEGRSVRVTDLERTVIDCIHRPKYAQGWENVVHALSRVEGANWRRLIEYVKQYRTPSLVAKVGLILEHFKDQWKVSIAALDSLRPYLPRTPVKFSRGSGGLLNKDWNIFVPEGVFHE
jgi:predicted transcriptional regulator of viral defense system